MLEAKSREPKQPRPSTLTGGRLKIGFSTMLFGFLLPDFLTQQETLRMVNGWFPFGGNT